MCVVVRTGCLLMSIIFTDSACTVLYTDALFLSLSRGEVYSDSPGQVSLASVLPEHHDTMCNGVFHANGYGALQWSPAWWLLCQLHCPQR